MENVFRHGLMKCAELLKAVEYATLMCQIPLCYDHYFLYSGLPLFSDATWFDYTEIKVSQEALCAPIPQSPYLPVTQRKRKPSSCRIGMLSFLISSSVSVP